MPAELLKLDLSLRVRFRLGLAAHARIIEPGSASIRKVKGPGAWVRHLALDWIIASSAVPGDGDSEGVLAMRFERQAATGEPGPLREVTLKITIVEASAKRQRHKVEARMIRHF